jgi:CDP-diacylglycerol pyrophosphatase
VRLLGLLQGALLPETRVKGLKEPFLREENGGGYFWLSERVHQV